MINDIVGMKASYVKKQNYRKIGITIPNHMDMCISCQECLTEYGLGKLFILFANNGHHV